MQAPIYKLNDSIAALATAQGTGAIAVIRLSGSESFKICDTLSKSKKISDQASHTLHFVRLYDGDNLLDEVVIGVFKAPHSYTGEDVAEISCHGSVLIQKRLLQALIKHGARLAEPGEFTLRAFLNKKMDLVQAEAVADLINAESEAAAQTALNQMRGGFSKEIEKLRAQLLDFASLVELELDFSEEDVAFADRSALKQTVQELLALINKLVLSFKQGNVLKEGFSCVIVGEPNAGKSTLLNALLNEDRAIVSAIAGTTRDTIEEAIQINGVLFRFVDTAGLRKDADSEIERVGIEKTIQKIKTAAIVIHLFDANEPQNDKLLHDFSTQNLNDTLLLRVANKADTCEADQLESYKKAGIIAVSALRGDIVPLIDALKDLAETNKITGNQTVVSNIRHVQELQHAQTALIRVNDAIENQITTDLLAEDLRDALQHLGAITGNIDTEEILGNIFGKFCIGK